MKKLISIIVPVYNTEVYLLECIESILQQNLRNIEIIAINDGSTDSSPQLLNFIASTDSRIIVINKPNGGISSARNLALKYATGDFVLFIDSDDLLVPDSLEQILMIATANDADIVCFGYQKLYKNTPKKSFLSSDSTYTKQISKQEFFQLCFDTNYKTNCSNGAYTWARLYKRSIVDSLTFDEQWTFYEDMDFFSRLVLSLKEKSKIFLCDVPMYYYRQRKSSLIHSHRSKRLFALYACLRKILKRYEKGTIQYDIISKDRLSTLIKIMQISLTSNRFGGFRLFKKILLSRNDLSLKTKLPYLLGPSVAKNYSVKRLKKAKQKNLKLQYWD